MSTQIRNYRESDLQLTVVLLNAAEAADHVEEGTSLEEQREIMARPGLHPEEDVFVAEDEGGRIVALAGMEFKEEAEESGFRSWLNVHPMFRGRGLEDRLLARLEERARAQLGQVKADKVYLSCIGFTAYPERLRAIERAGMKEIRRFWVMRRPDLNDLPTPRFPARFVVRSYRMGEDDAEALDALNDSFSEHFAYSPETPGSFGYYLHLDIYRPDLTVLAIDPRTNQIAGFCHIVVNEGECQRVGRRRGWIDILGVRKAYRHQGLGEALILQGMHKLREAGMTEATLGCDSENTTNATRLYFRVGFTVLREMMLFIKYLREPTREERAEYALAVR